ncbi:MAG: protein kinase [Bryobacterales bacterium]|nr:protein kinase [Bryobacterales bacterium]
MSPERWERVKDIFVEAEARVGGERASYIAEQCGSDGELRAEVERLLANDPPVAAIDRSPLPEGLLRGAAGMVGRIGAGTVLAKRFRIVRLLGAGGMGEVFQAEDTRLGQMVAIKTIRGELAADADAMARFRREISLARQVTHPAICRVFDFFSGDTEAPGQTIDFLTMEYVEGETLSARLKREGPLGFEEALPVIRQVAAALDAAHAARVMHRDLKSSNVLLGKDASGEMRAVVTDFGVARSTAGGDTIATGSGFAAGTPAYMAPEQLEGKELTAAADLYSLGVLMYEMATGTIPHAAESPLQIAARRMKEAPVRPGELRPVAAVWEAAILRCLEVAPGDRFGSGAELVAALESGRAGKKRREWRKPRVGLTAGVGAVAGLVVLVWLGRDWMPSKPVGEQAGRFYRDGVVALSDGAYYKAAQLLGMAVQAEPGFTAAHCRLAEAYQELDERDKAREELVKALDGAAWARHERLLREATKHYLTGDWEKAAEALRDRVGSVWAGDKTGAMLDLARLYERAGKGKEAIATYQEVLGRDDSQPAAAMGLAGLLHASGKREEVAGLLRRAERLYGVTQNPEGMGMLRLARGTFAANTDEAVAEAKKAEELGRQIGSASLEIQAKLLQARRIDYQGKGEEARVLANDAVALAEAKGMGALAARGLADLGMVPFSQRRYEEAEGLFWRAVALAQRYGAKRTEALAKMNVVNLASYQGVPEKQDAGVRLAKEVSEFFAATGDYSRETQVRRYHVAILRAKGKNEEAKKELADLLARSKAEPDIVAVKTDIGKLALLQGRYGEAERMFRDSVDYFRRTGDKQLEQNYIMWHARAMRRMGKIAEAHSTLLRMETEGLANDTVRSAFGDEMADLEFQMFRFDESLARLERLLGEAERNQQPRLARSRRVNLCIKYAEAGRAAKALAACPGLLAEHEDQPSQIVVLHEAMATAHLTGGDKSASIRHAREALRVAGKAQIHADITYSLLLLTQAQHAVGDVEWRATQGRVLASIEDWKQEAGVEPVVRHMELPVIKRRFTAVQALQ